MLLLLATLLVGGGALAAGQRDDVPDPSPQECFTSGSIVGAVVGTIVILTALAALCYAFWKYYWTRRQEGKTLTLVTDDPEVGLADQHYAFDNPGFLTEDMSPQKKMNLKASPNDGKSTLERNQINVDPNKAKGGKWQPWTSFSALVGASGKKNNSFKAMDDSFVGEPEREFVPLKGHDFTGLGFNICGNMREGIFVRDVLHRGPASESGRILAGDRIVSINISLRHMVFEDALTILSYASPYDVQLEIEKRPQSRAASGSGKRSPSVGPPDRLCHPFYRSQSIDDLNKMRKSSMGARQAKMRKSSPGESPSQHVRVVSNTGTSGRKETSKPEKEAAVPAMRSNTTMPKPERAKKAASVSSINSATTPVPEKAPRPTSMEKMAKFGVKVLPFNLTNELNQRAEAKSLNDSINQNEQNMKIEEETPISHGEETPIDGDESDEPNRLKQMDKMLQVVSEMKSKVEEKNIPTELPEEMRLAAQAAVSHRKSLKFEDEKTMVVNKNTESIDEMDKKKRRAPPPPVTNEQQFEEGLARADEDVVDVVIRNGFRDTVVAVADDKVKPHDGSENTIELGSSHITIHQAGKDEDVGPKGRERKAASLGDLSRFDSEQPMSIPLERAVSLDMVDVNEETVPGGAKKHKKFPTVSIAATSETAMTDTSLQEDEEELTPTNSPLRKEPAMLVSDIAGTTDTFNRRLKKSSQWGTLEEALNFELTSSTVGVSKKDEDLKTVITVATDEHSDDILSSGPSSITYINPDEPPVPPTSPPPTITFISTATPSLQHITEIQVLTTGGNVSEVQSPFSMDYTSSTTIRHGTSGGNLLLVANKMEDEQETNAFSVNDVDEVGDAEEFMEELADSHLTESEDVVQISTNNVTVMPINLKREVLQITANELDDIMMSHSSYLKTTQSPDNNYSAFEQWVFLDQEPKIIKAPEEDKKDGSGLLNENKN